MFKEEIMYYLFLNYYYRNFVFYDKFKYFGDVLPILFMCLDKYFI